MKKGGRMYCHVCKVRNYDNQYYAKFPINCVSREQFWEFWKKFLENDQKSESIIFLECESTITTKWRLFYHAIWKIYFVSQEIIDKVKRLP